MTDQDLIDGLLALIGLSRPEAEHLVDAHSDADIGCGCCGAMPYFQAGVCQDCLPYVEPLPTESARFQQSAGITMAALDGALAAYREAMVEQMSRPFTAFEERDGTITFRINTSGG